MSTEAAARAADRIEAVLDGLPERHAVLLPDLFVDHFVPLDGVAAFHAAVDEVAARGGGNHLVHGQSHRVGGNAANTAYALGRLGVPCTLVARTAGLGCALFARAVHGLPVRTDRVLDVGVGSTTVALEFKEGGANVMLSDPGPLASFGPDDLEEADWSLIDSADLVAITNWSQALGGGTALLQAVLPRVARRGGFTFIDIGDPSHRGEAVRVLLDTPALHAHLSAWGMNGTEARYLARVLDGQERTDPMEAVQALSRRLPGRLDLHTARGAVSYRRGVRVGEAPSFDFVPRQRTGGGDAWNAGNLLGEMLGLDDEGRLIVAHAIPALTLTDPTTTPPDMPALLRYLRSGTTG